MAQKIEKLAKSILNDPVRITLEIAKPAENISQEAYRVQEPLKIELISKLIGRYTHFESILVFTSTKKKVSDIVKGLKKAGLEAKGISSMLEQDEREAILLKFRAKKVRILVATDVLSRGIDIKDINLVINLMSLVMPQIMFIELGELPAPRQVVLQLRSSLKMMGTK